MYKPLITLAIVMLAIVPVSYAEDWPSIPFLVVEGDAFVEVPPEKATIELQVVAFAKESEVAVATIQQRVTRVLEVFEKFDIPRDAITSFSLRKNVHRARHENHQPLEILGYYVRRRIEVELSDISRFSDLIAELAGLDNVSNIDAKFDVIKRDDIEGQLTRQAGTDARRKAENMAAAMGVSVGNVHAISETGFRFDGITYGLGPRLVYSKPAKLASPRPYEDTVFMPATITIVQSLNVVFEIEH